jgi:hypothetical protein
VVGRSRWHHGWANLRKQEEPALGPSRTDGARLAACHRFRKGEGVARKKKDGGRGLPPCEDARARVWLLARRSLLQKSVGDVWSRISPANALQKERQGRVNGDLAPRSRRWVKPSARAWGETTNRASTFTARKAVKDRRKAQGGERSPSSGRTIAKAVRWSRGRGCKGHRILRRVPAGRRHPGHHETSAFTRRRGRWPWRFRHPPTRTNPVQSRTSGQVAALAKASEA